MGITVSLQVNIEDLVASGAAVTGQGEDFPMKHCASNTRVETAHVGWQGRSTTTTTLLTQLSDHTQGLHTCAQHLSAMEQRHVQALEMPGQQTDSIATRV